jgi:hypothetical protein
MMYLFYGLLLSIILILSFLGWGMVVSRGLLGPGKQDWPFQAAWGVCLVMCLGGVFTVFSLVSPALNLVVVCLGLIAWALLGDMRAWPARCRQSWRETPEWAVLLTFFGLLCVAQHLRSLYPVPWNPNDDSLAYAAFPRKLLDTGALIEPFSFRRLAGYGGFVYLHSLVLSVLPPTSLHLVDMGIMNTLSAFALAYYARRQLNAPPFVAGLAGLASAYWLIPRVNLSPSSILGLLSLSLLHVVRVTDTQSKNGDWRPGLLIGLVAAGLVSVRVTALGFLLPFAGFILLCAGLRGRRFRAELGRWVVGGCFAVLLLTPWALALRQSSNTLLWPLIQGNCNTAIPLSNRLGMAGELAWLWANLHSAGWEYVALVATLGVWIGALTVYEACYAAAALMVALVTIHSINLFPVRYNFRYYAAFTQVTAILTVASLAGFFLSAKLAKASRVASMAASLVICGLAVYFKPSKWIFFRSMKYATPHDFIAFQPAPYADAFACIPKGAKVLAELNWPCSLDYGEHVIYNIDFIGMASPGRGLVLQGDPEGLLDYLREQGIAYLVFVRPNKGFEQYNRLVREKNFMEGYGSVNRPLARNALWFFNAVDVLSKRYPVSFESDVAVVLPIPPKSRHSESDPVASGVDRHRH